MEDNFESMEGLRWLLQLSTVRELRMDASNESDSVQDPNVHLGTTPSMAGRFDDHRDEFHPGNGCLSS